MGSPLTPDDLEYQFPKQLYRGSMNTTGKALAAVDGSTTAEGIDIRYLTVATSGEEAQAKADGWSDNQPDAIAAGKRALQEQQERDREAADRRYIERRKRLKRLDRQADLETGGDESTAVKNLTEPPIDAKAATRPEVFYTLAQAREKLRVKKTTLWRWGKAGRIKIQGTGKRQRVSKAEVDRINSER